MPTRVTRVGKIARDIGADRPASASDFAHPTRVLLRALGRGTSAFAAQFLFTMSNSAVFFLPAARCCARVLLSSFPSASWGASGAPKGALFLLSRCRARRSALPEA